MRAAGRNRATVAAALAFLAVLALAACVATGHVCDSDAQLFAGLVGLLVLVVYTRETYLLRLVAERQFETAEKPVLLFELSSIDSQLGQQMDLKEPTLRNIGSGPAFDVTIDSLKGDDVEAQFRLPGGSLVGSKQQVPVAPFVIQDGQPNGISGWTLLLANLIRQGKFPKDAVVSVRYKSLSGKTYGTRHRIKYDAMAKLVSTSYEGTDEG